MNSTPYILPTSIIANAPGVNGWIDPDNIFLVDNQYAVASGISNILEVGNFNLNIPQGSDITNFTVQVKGYIGSTAPNLQIYAVDDTSGVPLAYPMAPFSGFSATNTLYTLPSTLFGTTWTVDQANNIKFQLVCDGELYLDAILVSADYVPAVTPNQTLYYSGLSGTFQPGETLSDLTSGATATVATNDGAGILTISGVTGTFAVGDSIKGLSSLATATVSTPTGIAVTDEFVEAQPFQLAQSMTATDLYMFLQSFNYPDGVTQIQYADFYGDACLVIDQGVPGREEQVVITNVEQDYQGTGLCRLSFGTLANRGLKFSYPYTSVPANIVSHFGTAEVVISNSAKFYSRFLRINQIGALVSAPITVDNQDTPLATPATELDFEGGGVTVANDGTNAGKKIITIPGSGTSQPIVVSTSSATTGASQEASLTWNHTASGINRTLTVQVETEAANTITGITFNGTALTQAVTANAGTIRNEEWYLTAPAVGTYPIVVTMSAPSYITAGAESWVSTNQSSPIGATQTATGTGLSPSLTLTTTSDNSFVVDSLATGTLPIVYTAGAGQQVNWNVTANPNARQGASSLKPAGTAPDAVTMAWSITQSVPWVQTAVEIKGVPPSSAGVTQIIAGTNVTITPSGGTGAVTINSSGGSSGISSINGNTSTAQVIAGGSGIAVSSTGGTTTITNTGGGGTVNPSTMSYLFDDFVGGPANAIQQTAGAVEYFPTLGEIGWSSLIPSTAAIVTIAGLADHPGIIQVQPNGSNGDFAGIYLATKVGPMNSPSTTITASVNTPTTLLSGYQNFFGFCGSAIPASAGNYESSSVQKIGFIADGTTGNWFGYASDGTTQNVTAGVAVGGTASWDALVIAVDSTGSNASFTVNGTVLGTLAIPSGTVWSAQVQFASGKASGTGTPGGLSVDYFSFARALTR